MNTTTKRIFWGATATLMALAGQLAAGTITQTVTIPVSNNNWTATANFNKFDTNGGEFTLQQVNFTVSSIMTATVGVENTSTSAGTSVTSLQTYTGLSLQRPDTTEIVYVKPLIEKTSFALATYDGTTDYAGTSGYSYTASTQETKSSSLTSAADLNLFTGNDVIHLVMNASSNVLIGYSGGVPITYSSNDTGATVTLVYTYVPEPAMLTLVALGGLAFLGRRKRT